MIPGFTSKGLLPQGIHEASWTEVAKRFGVGHQRSWLLSGLRRAARHLASIGCATLYLDGSFVTAKSSPSDYYACWSVTGVDEALVDPVLFKFDDGRKAMKAKYFGDLFPVDFVEEKSGKTFLDFFQCDRETGLPKGIVVLTISDLHDS